MGASVTNILIFVTSNLIYHEHASDVVYGSMYATFRKSTKHYDRGPTNHITSR